MNIVYTTRDFNGDDALNEKDYIFAHPCPERAQEKCEIDFSAIGERKLIYISLGSFNTDFADFYKMCIAAFGGGEYFVCMSIGKKCAIEDIGEIPQNFFVKSFLPQIEILKHADAFITHAGFNSINEALYFGVPMLALPMVNDQHMQQSAL